MKYHLCVQAFIQTLTFVSLITKHCLRLPEEMQSMFSPSIKKTCFAPAKPLACLSRRCISFIRASPALMQSRAPTAANCRSVNKSSVTVPLTSEPTRWEETVGRYLIETTCVWMLFKWPAYSKPSHLSID